MIYLVLYLVPISVRPFYPTTIPVSSPQSRGGRQILSEPAYPVLVPKSKTSIRPPARLPACWPSPRAPSKVAFVKTSPRSRGIDERKNKQCCVTSTQAHTHTQGVWKPSRLVPGQGMYRGAIKAGKKGLVQARGGRFACPLWARSRSLAHSLAPAMWSRGGLRRRWQKGRFT